MRYVDDGHARGLEPGHQRKQALRLARGQRGGGLVHDEQARIAGQRPGNLHQLLLGHDELAHACVRVQQEAYFGKRLARLLTHRLVVKEEALLDLVAQEDVLRNRQVVRQVELLVDQHNALRLGRARAAARGAHGTVHHHLAGGRALVPRQNLHQRGLARAVLAQQAIDAARLQRKAHAVQHAHRAKLLGDVAELDGYAHRTAPTPTPAADPDPEIEPARDRLSCIASTPAPTTPASSASGAY